MDEILSRAKFAVVEKDDYSDVNCEECGSGEDEGELLLCDKCDKGFHMGCVRPVVARVPIGSWVCPTCSGHPRVRSRGLSSILFSWVMFFFFIFDHACFFIFDFNDDYFLVGLSQKKIIDFFRIQKCNKGGNYKYNSEGNG